MDIFWNCTFASLEINKTHLKWKWSIHENPKSPPINPADITILMAVSILHHTYIIWLQFGKCTCFLSLEKENGLEKKHGKVLNFVYKNVPGVCKYHGFSCVKPGTQIECPKHQKH